MNTILSIGSTFAYIGYILIALALLLLMIMIHESGHYFAGKLLKFKINEFSVGFGKALFSKQLKRGEKFSLRLIPLGGYCAFEGEDEGKETPGSFNSEAPWKRLIVLFMGAFFNFLSACIVAVAALMIAGTGVRTVTEVTPDFEYNQEFRVGDKILAVGDTTVSAVFSANYLFNTYDVDEEIPVTVLRDGKKENITVKFTPVEENGKVTYYIGVTTSPDKLSFGKSLISAVPYCSRIAWDCLTILGQLFTGKLGLSTVSGPISTIGQIAQVTAISPISLVLLFVLIGVNLATFNLLPFPSLDGARMVFVLIEWIRGKPINRKIEGYINSVGLILLLTFVVIVDLMHLF